MRALSLLLVAVCSISLAAQQAGPPTITNQDILAGLQDGTKWLTYSGNYFGHRYSPLTQITPENVGQLKSQWTFQTGSIGNFQSTPLVIDGVLYVTGWGGDAWAIDARSGRQIWRHRRNPPDDIRACCGPNNRGFGALGDRLFLGTADAHLLALDMRTGAGRLGRRAYQLQIGVLGDRRAACREGQSDRWRCGCRVRHSRIHRCVRCSNRKAGVAVLHRCRSG